jgi:hypothetical protein
MKQNDTSALRIATISYWATFAHARHEVDVARVHAFQALVRDAEEKGPATDDQVTGAYGGRGWAPAPTCHECGARDDNNVLFGPAHDISLCGPCLSEACALSFGVTPPVPSVKPTKPGFFTRLFKGA